MTPLFCETLKAIYPQTPSFVPPHFGTKDKVAGVVAPIILVQPTPETDTWRYTLRAHILGTCTDTSTKYDKKSCKYLNIKI